MDKPVKKEVPKSLFVLIIVILASMFYYAAYKDPSNPEVIVRNFYNAYFQNDYETVAQNLSVFWGAQFMPQYMLMSPEELIEKRPIIEKNMTKLISQIESQNKIPDDMNVKILSKYTQRQKNTGLVVYELREKNKPINLEMALLLKENNRMYLLQWWSIDREQLQQLNKNDLVAIEAYYSELLGL